ncbi:ABC transporter permease [Bartonella sp. HY329]|uniref:cell division protein FtsX n=1 Tax=unclassified Bartonella TaxID=2645622 RepID=UPI0021C650B5|nr:MULTISPECIES: ABC transporter permease [unclassified Bartonella]UXM95828.1 ABC transporter permease [Bartonella sp. HY329]UXN10153.1 ABC transporter permease [Bartonella sp. HY328]
MTDSMEQKSAKRPIGRLLGKKSNGLTPIVPEGDIRGFALAVVLTIMTFLASLSLGGVNLINTYAKNWQSDISREATIQIMPGDNINMEEALKNSVRLVTEFPGVKEARILDREETQSLLEPWLGSGINVSELPIPRLIIVTFDQGSAPDTFSLRELIKQNVPNANFDDHRMWVDQLSSVANSFVAVGLGVFMLVLVALILTIVFATRSTLSNNNHIIEVLHFIGAEAGFVARQFDWYFFKTGLKGATIGALAALALFFMFSLWSSYNNQSPQAMEMTMLFGTYSIGWVNIVETFLLIFFVAFLTMFTSRITVIRQLREIDSKETGFFARNT